MAEETGPGRVRRNPRPGEATESTRQKNPGREALLQIPDLRGGHGGEAMASSGSNWSGFHM